jgi:hypothetical protein
VDFEAVKLHFQSNHLSFYSFFPKSEKPIKAVIRHLPNNTPAEDIAEGLGDIGFDVVSVRQMSTSRRSPEGTPVTLPLFLVTLPRTVKSQEIFKLSSLLPHHDQGRGLQIPKPSHPVLQLPKIWPRLGEL